MSDAAPGIAAVPADGLEARWSTWDDAHTEALVLRWENEAWTATGRVGRERVEYVIRLSPLWHVRQFILFRDLDEPDLWLGTDGHGRWGEVNGAHRPDLDGPRDVALACTPFTLSLPIRRLPLRVGDRTDLRVLDVDVETLGVVPASVTYARPGARRWHVGRADRAVEFDVDQYGLVHDLEGEYRRVA